jgi:hypothetical protein
MGKTLIFGLIVILGLNFLALFYGWYPEVPWLDLLLHFMGGVWVAAFSAWFFKEEKRPVFILSFVALIGVLWELAEFSFLNDLVAYLFKAAQAAATLEDTLSDLLFDLLGGLAFIACLFYRSKKLI